MRQKRKSIFNTFARSGTIQRQETETLDKKLADRSNFESSFFLFFCSS